MNDNIIIKMAIIGTQGIPAQYGGFETLVDFLTKYLSEKIDITVFCSKEHQVKLNTYNKSHLEYIYLSANGWQGIIYDSLSIIKSYKKYDKILILGCSNIVMSFMNKYKEKFILNIGGIEWKRVKWGFFARTIIKYSEKITVRNSRYLISDNEGIQNYLLEMYNRNSELIEYGGDQVKRINDKIDFIVKYPFLECEYILAVARIQEDNNIGMILESLVYGKLYKIVIIGNWSINGYGKSLKIRYKNIPNVILLDAIYDYDELNVIRTNAKIYIHGHSAGGTNPGLVEAMYLGLPIFCFSNSFNHYTTEEKALYFETSEELYKLLLGVSNETLSRIATDLKEIAERRYKWEIIINKYLNTIIPLEGK